MSPLRSYDTPEAGRAATLALALTLVGTVAASAYVLLDDRWSEGAVAMHLQIAAPSAPLSDGSITYDESAESALAAWNQYISRVQFRIVRDSTAPRGDGNGINNVFFATDIYGMGFGRETLAVTTEWRRRGTRTEADVIFNSSAGVWDSYPGPLRRGVNDFRRVALHEFGHVLGLDHPDENGQAVSSIMNSHVSNLDHLTDDDVAAARALYAAAAPGDGSAAGAMVSFPPRDESLRFRIDLEAKYRDGLRRGSTPTYVDAEGAVIWLQEYLRYRVNQCTHQQAVDRVMAQIDGGGAAPVCGLPPPGPTRFPASNEPMAFYDQLEAKYKDALRRAPAVTHVDPERQVVWTEEYLRYRAGGCGHALAVQNVFAEIDGLPAPPLCR